MDPCDPASALPLAGSQDDHLDLQDRKMTVYCKKILPAYGRYVAFSTTDFSNHGVPPHHWQR